MRPHFLPALLVASVFGVAGCRRHAATATDCAGVLDRLVELELTESGYRDPLVRARWKEEARRRFAPDLTRCEGLIVRSDLGRCLRSAKTTEEIRHHCVE